MSRSLNALAGSRLEKTVTRTAATPLGVRSVSGSQAFSDVSSELMFLIAAEQQKACVRPASIDVETDEIHSNAVPLVVDSATEPVSSDFSLGDRLCSVDTKNALRAPNKCVASYQAAHSASLVGDVGVTDRPIRNDQPRVIGLSNHSIAQGTLANRAMAGNCISSADIPSDDPEQTGISFRQEVPNQQQLGLTPNQGQKSESLQRRRDDSDDRSSLPLDQVVPTTSSLISPLDTASPSMASKSDALQRKGIATPIGLKSQNPLMPIAPGNATGLGLPESDTVSKQDVELANGAVGVGLEVPSEKIALDSRDLQRAFATNEYDAERIGGVVESIKAPGDQFVNASRPTDATAVSPDRQLPELSALAFVRSPDQEPRTIRKVSVSDIASGISSESELSIGDTARQFLMIPRSDAYSGEGRFHRELHDNWNFAAAAGNDGSAFGSIVAPLAGALNPLSGTEAAVVTGIPGSVREICNSLIQNSPALVSGKRFSVKIHHPELGVVQLTATVEDGRVQVGIQTRLEQSAAVLMANRDGMQAILRDAGLHGAQCDIAWDSHQERQAHRDSIYYEFLNADDESAGRGDDQVAQRNEIQRVSSLNLTL